jgi:UDP-glucose 4-epimerase
LRVLVTGGAGYVGGFTARHLAARGHEVTVLDDLSLGHAAAAPPGSLVVGDVGDAALVESLLRERRVEAVLHFAASSSVPESVREPEKYWRNNVQATQTLLDAMQRAAAHSLVFSSTCAVYGETADGALAEDSPLAPAVPYASTKLEAERRIADCARTAGLRFANLRYFNAAGATPDGAHGEHHEPEGHLVPIALQTALGQRERLIVYGSDYPTPDGTCIRDYVGVEDLADAHARALAWAQASPAGLGLTLNLGSGRGCSVLEVIGAVERVTGAKLPVTRGPRRPGDTAKLVARADAAHAALGWRPKSDLDAIVASAWQWHRTHPHGYTDE